ALVAVGSGGPDDPAGLALLAEPAPPLGLLGAHLLRRHPGVVDGGRLLTVAGRLRVAVRRPRRRPGAVRVLVLQVAQGVPDLVQGDQRALGAAAGRRGVPAADTAVRERVEDGQRLQVLRVGRDAELRRDVLLEVHRALLVAVAAEVTENPRAVGSGRVALGRG